MVLSSILPGTDSLFKYLLTIGFIMLFFALIYPLQKEHELKIEELDLLMKVENLEYDITELGLRVEKLKNSKEITSKQIKEFKILIQELKHKNIDTKYEIKKHRELERQIKSYGDCKINCVIKLK